MNFLTLKALHIIFVITWFAGLFYIVRLFIYHVEAKEKEEPERSILQRQFQVMERRLWYGITWPSAILALSFGGRLAMDFLPLTDHPWLITKIIFVALLFLYHLYCGKIYKCLCRHKKTLTSFQLRIFNEIATLFLLAIVFLVVLKTLLHALYGSLGLMLMALIFYIAIWTFKKKWK